MPVVNFVWTEPNPSPQRTRDAIIPRAAIVTFYLECLAQLSLSLTPYVKCVRAGNWA